MGGCIAKSIMYKQTFARLRGGPKSFLVDTGLRQLRQSLVCPLLFVEVLIEQSDGIAQAKLVRPGLQRPVPADLIMLDGLSGGDEAGVKSSGIFEYLHEFLALVDKSVDCIAGFALG